MRDYWLTQAALQAVGWSYLLITATLFGLALWIPKRAAWKFIAAFTVVALASFVPITEYQQLQQDRKVAAEKAKAGQEVRKLFDSLCKDAGDKIYQRAENVEGIRLLNVRELVSGGNQYGPNAVLETAGEGYIRSFLLYERERAKNQPRRLIENRDSSSLRGYRFVEIVDPSTGKVVQYSLLEGTSMQRIEVDKPSAKYAVAFDDPVDPELRRFWIAKSVVRVTDLTTQKVMAESIRYVMDPRHGSRDGSRAPWLFARACGRDSRLDRHETRLFVDQVLKPLQLERRP